MTTYEKYLQWKAEQTSESPSIKDFCEWLDNPNKIEMVRQDKFGKIALTDSNNPCNSCVFYGANHVDACCHCLNNNTDEEYYYAKPD